jgi:hypothetical protein
VKGLGKEYAIPQDNVGFPISDTGSMTIQLGPQWFFMRSDSLLRPGSPALNEVLQERVCAESPATTNIEPMSKCQCSCHHEALAENKSTDHTICLLYIIYEATDLSR